MCDLFQFNKHTSTVFRVQEYNRIPMRPDFGFGVKGFDTFLFEGLKSSVNVVDLNTDMVHATAGVFLQEASDGTLVSQRQKELDLGVRELDKNDSDSMFREILGLAHGRTEHITIQLCRALEFRHSNSNMIEPANFPRSKS